MNWKHLDSARRDAGAIEVDLIEAYAQGKINRRNFVKRGAVIGLSVPFMGGIIAACGGSDDAGDGNVPDTGGGDDAAPTSEGSSGGGGQGGTILAGIQTGDANSGLDPLNMLDLGTYSVLSQSFEYLVGLAEDGSGGIGPTALASDWSPNDDGSVWTFTLREGIMWQDDTPFTSADVVATLDRMAVKAAGVGGVLSEGGAVADGDLSVVVTLDAPNGNFPALVSIYNPQSLITPSDYTDGTTLDERSTGTGAWILDNFDAGAFTATFTPNPNWWGGTVNLDSITLQGFDSGGTQVAAMASGEIDMIQQFSVSDGANLLEADGFTLLKPPSSNHRQIWFNTQLPEGGPFTDPRVRQAVCFAVNRQQIIDSIYEGQARVANDHPVFMDWEYFDESQEQRPHDPEMARQLLADAGHEGLSGSIRVGDLQEVPAVAAIVAQNLAEAGFQLDVQSVPNSDFYGIGDGQGWCPADTEDPTTPCGNSAQIGIVDYGHRPTPDIFFGRALSTGGDWNSSNYASDEFDSLFSDFQSSVDVDGQKDACGKIQRLLHEDSPACYAYFFDYLSGHSSNIEGVEVTALGHMQFQKATKS
ncbi:MAG: ABC transporter substrate-binding protein [Ilumatobacter sp.]|uniref:ABC transporter substrate-binding protein n=1 Tax=Ilumatobacter sp. TaxID=1967498 RepID=UPI003C70656B